LVPVNVFVPGTAGTIVFGTPAGIEVFTLTGAEGTAAAAAVVINAQARGIFATAVGGKVVLYSEYGPAGDIIYMGDNVAGALNTALGDYTLGAGAAFTPGVYGNKVAVDVPVDGRLRINGDLEYTGALIPAPSGGGGGFGSYKAVTPPDHPYTTLVTEGIFGVRLGAGADIEVELNAAYTTGATVIIKDENAIADAIPAPGGQKITITDNAGGLIEGGVSYDITVGGGAVTLYKNNVGDWFIV
jgi:hypothetical protein